MTLAISNLNTIHKSECMRPPWNLILCLLVSLTACQYAASLQEFTFAGAIEILSSRLRSQLQNSRFQEYLNSKLT